MTPWSAEYPLRDYMRDRLSGIPVAPLVYSSAGEEPQDLFVRGWSEQVEAAFLELCEEEVQELQKTKVVGRPELLARLMKLAMQRKDERLAKRLLGKKGARLQALAGAKFEGWSLLHWAALLAHRTLPKEQAAGILVPLLARTDDWALSSIVRLSGLRWELDGSAGKTEFGKWVLRLLSSLLKAGKADLMQRLLADSLERYGSHPQRVVEFIAGRFKGNDLEEVLDHFPPEASLEDLRVRVALDRARLGRPIDDTIPPPPASGSGFWLTPEAGVA